MLNETSVPRKIIHSKLLIKSDNSACFIYKLNSRMYYLRLDVNTSLEIQEVGVFFFFFFICLIRKDVYIKSIITLRDEFRNMLNLVCQPYYGTLPRTEITFRGTDYNY